ncbi:MAG: hypothetical protein ABGX25_06955, partial [Nautiliaceae bacterium]
SSIRNFDSENNFTYFDRDLNVYSLMEINITAENKDNEITKNYNVLCAAKPIEINITNKLSHTDNFEKLIYFYTDANDTNSSEANISVDSQIEYSIEYNESNFTTENNGSTKIVVYFNFDRNISNPINPLEVNVTEIKVKDENNVTGEVNLTDRLRYYYGNIKTVDIIATDDNIEANMTFLVYAKNGEDPLLPSSTKEVEYNWFINTIHGDIDGNISINEINISSGYAVSNDISGVSVSYAKVENGGKLVVDVNRSDNNVDFAVFHLLSPRFEWLWYSRFGEEYNISNGSSCKNHFCFTITWENGGEQGEVGSGDFEGKESNITKTNNKRRGVKIYR